MSGVLVQGRQSFLLCVTREEKRGDDRPSPPPRILSTLISFITDDAGSDRSGAGSMGTLVSAHQETQKIRHCSLDPTHKTDQNEGGKMAFIA